MRRRAGGERLSELELIHNCIFLLNAGHETTTNLIGNGVDLLLRHPDAMSDWPSIPTPSTRRSRSSCAWKARTSSATAGRRATHARRTSPCRPAPTCISASAPPTAIPEQFPDPDRLDIRRQPNRHLAFGIGIHACAGMSLARMEAQVAIGKLVRRFTTIERAGPPMRGGRARFRGFARYPIAVQKHKP